MIILLQKIRAFAFYLLCELRAARGLRTVPWKTHTDPVTRSESPFAPPIAALGEPTDS